MGVISFSFLHSWSKPLKQICAVQQNLLAVQKLWKLWKRTSQIQRTQPQDLFACSLFNFSVPPEPIDFRYCLHLQNWSSIVVMLRFWHHKDFKTDKQTDFNRGAVRENSWKCFLTLCALVQARERTSGGHSERSRRRRRRRRSKRRRSPRRGSPRHPSTYWLAERMKFPPSTEVWAAPDPPCSTCSAFTSLPPSHHSRCRTDGLWQQQAAFIGISGPWLVPNREPSELGSPRRDLEQVNLVHYQLTCLQMLERSGDHLSTFLGCVEFTLPRSFLEHSKSLLQIWYQILYVLVSLKRSIVVSKGPPQGHDKWQPALQTWHSKRKDKIRDGIHQMTFAFAQPNANNFLGGESLRGALHDGCT